MKHLDMLETMARYKAEDKARRLRYFNELLRQLDPFQR